MSNLVMFDGAVFGAEVDDRSRLVAMVTRGFTPTPLNQLPDSCPRCMGGNTWIVALIKRMARGVMFRSCRECGWAKCLFDSENC